MPSDLITVNSRKYDGHINRSWTARLLNKNGPLIELIGTFEQDIFHEEIGHIASGTHSYEYFWLDRWYSIFRFHSPDGAFRSFYCNINRPPTFDNKTLDYIDLDIDILVDSDSNYRVVDLAEFEVNAARYGYSQSVREKASAAVDELICLIAERRLPMPDTGEKL